MRLWHKDLIDVLPDKQLVGQWRECCLIAKGLHDGTLNHVLVNKVKNYPLQDFANYTARVWQEMCNRGKNPIWRNFQQYLGEDITSVVLEADVYPDWHNVRYLKQCFFNLQEKFDCGGITWSEWVRVVSKCDILNEEL